MPTPDEIKQMRLQLDPGDDEAETQLIRALADDVAPRLEREFRAWLRELFGPNMSEAEILDWERRLQTGNARFRDVLERALVDATDLGVTVGIDQLAQVGIGFDWTLVNTRARENARQYAGQLITQITDTTRNTVREAVARFIDNGEPLSALVQDLRASGFSQRRAKLIAATEVTGAFTRANEEAYRESGVVEMVEWYTANDERVCPVCGRLHGQRVPLGQLFEGIYKPAAHPGCRCRLAPVVKTPQEIAEAAAAAIAPSTPAVDPNNPYGYAPPEEVRAQLEALTAPNQKKIEKLRRDIAKAEAEYEQLHEQWLAQPYVFDDDAEDPLRDKVYAQWNVIVARKNELDKALNVFENMTYRERMKLAEKARQILAVQVPTPVTIQSRGPFKPIDYQKGVDGFRTLVDGRVLPPSVQAMNIRFEQISIGERASAQSGVIRMSFLTTEKSIVHELGHLLEDTSPDLMARAIAWRNGRTTGEALQQLSQLIPNSSFHPSEVAKPDKFITPYIGKHYIRADGTEFGTEVFSIGLDNMYEDAVRFAREDPDMFDFIYKASRGMQ